MSDTNTSPEPSKLEIGDAFGEDVANTFEQIMEKRQRIALSDPAGFIPPDSQSVAIVRLYAWRSMRLWLRKTGSSTAV